MREFMFCTLPFESGCYESCSLLKHLKRYFKGGGTVIFTVSSQIETKYAHKVPFLVTVQYFFIYSQNKRRTCVAPDKKKKTIIKAVPLQCKTAHICKSFSC